jgi:hypothetical protein
MVSDIRAVNRSQHEQQPSDRACGYIGFARLSAYLIYGSAYSVVSLRGSTVPNQPAGVFWAVVNRLFIIFQLVFLLLSEISWPIAFFDRFFPVLGSQFGLGPLGIFQAL